MRGSDCTVKSLLVAIVLLLGLIAVRLYWNPDARVSADSARFDHVYLLSSGFLYQGQTGVLLMDRRNGNVWFLGKGNQGNVPVFKDPVFLIRLPLDKLDEAPR
jgi:hypothetical protein